MPGKKYTFFEEQPKHATNLHENPSQKGLLGQKVKIAYQRSGNLEKNKKTISLVARVYACWLRTSRAGVFAKCKAIPTG
jgi:hypothetical protein